MIGEDLRGREPDGYLGRMPYSVNVYLSPWLERGRVLQSRLLSNPGAYMHPLTYMDLLVASGEYRKALAVLAEQHAATVDRRLRAVGL